MANDIVVVGVARTAVGSFNGAFANTPAHELGAAAIKAALSIQVGCAQQRGQRVRRQEVSGTAGEVVPVVNPVPADPDTGPGW